MLLALARVAAILTFELLLRAPRPSLESTLCSPALRSNGRVGCVRRRGRDARHAATSGVAGERGSV